MKKRLKIIALLLMSQIIGAQVYEKVVLLSDKKDGQTIIMAVEETKEAPVNLENKIFNFEETDIKPNYHNGINAFYDFFYKNYVKPTEVELKGEIFLSFVIEKDGSITGCKVLRDIGYGTGMEAIRVLKISPKWIPAAINGITVRTLYLLTVPIE